MEQAYYRLLNDILRGYDRCTPTKIVRLRNNQIFVFGTDSKGSQKYGAAGLAAKSFGAKVGVVDGPTGMCYALPTMGFTEQDLAKAVERFEQYVRLHLNYTFLVTAVGCGHAGFDVTRVANMFKGLLGLRNVMIPNMFLKVYRKECDNYFSILSGKNKCKYKSENKIENILQYFDDRVHDVVRYLIENNMPFNHEGGFTLQNDKGIIIAEAELCIEKEKIIFYPYDKDSERTFINAGFKVMTPSEFFILNR